MIGQRRLGPQQPEGQVPGLERLLQLQPTQMERQIAQLSGVDVGPCGGQRQRPASVSVAHVDQEPLRAVFHVRQPLGEAAVEDGARPVAGGGRQFAQHLHAFGEVVAREVRFGREQRPVQLVLRRRLPGG